MSKLHHLPRHHHWKNQSFQIVLNMILIESPVTFHSAKFLYGVNYMFLQDNFISDLFFWVCQELDDVVFQGRKFLHKVYIFTKAYHSKKKELLASKKGEKMKTRQLIHDASPTWRWASTTSTRRRSRIAAPSGSRTRRAC